MEKLLFDHFYLIKRQHAQISFPTTIPRPRTFFVSGDRPCDALYKKRKFWCYVKQSRARGKRLTLPSTHEECLRAEAKDTHLYQRWISTLTKHLK